MLNVVLNCPANHCHTLKTKFLCSLSLELLWEVNIQKLEKSHNVATEVNIHQTLAVQMRFAFTLQHDAAGHASHSTGGGGQAEGPPLRC